MNLNLNQTKLVGLTMELDLKVREYKNLCEKLDKLKENNIDESDSELIGLRQEFLENYKEIVKINQLIKELKNIQNSETKENQIEYNKENTFKKIEKNIADSKEENKELDIIKTDSLLKRLINKIKSIINLF